MDLFEKEVDLILLNKSNEIDELLKNKGERKQKSDIDIESINYSVNKVIKNIKTETERKMKSSKLFKKINSYDNVITNNG